MIHFDLKMHYLSNVIVVVAHFDVVVVVVVNRFGLQKTGFDCVDVDNVVVVVEQLVSFSLRIRTKRACILKHIPCNNNKKQPLFMESTVKKCKILCIFGYNLFLTIIDSLKGVKQ